MIAAFKMFFNMLTTFLAAGNNTAIALEILSKTAVEAAGEMHQASQLERAARIAELEKKHGIKLSAVKPLVVAVEK